MALTVEKVAKKVCPRCRTPGRLLLGPFYDKRVLRCQECGYRFRWVKRRRK